MFGFELATLSGVADLDLHGRVVDPEALGKRAAERVQERVARMAGGHHEMRSERVLGRAHRPDVEIVYLGNAG